MGNSRVANIFHISGYTQLEKHEKEGVEEMQHTKPCLYSPAIEKFFVKTTPHFTLHPSVLKDDRHRMLRDDYRSEGKKRHKREEKDELP